MKIFLHFVIYIQIQVLIPHFGIHRGKVSHILGYTADWEKYSAFWDTLGKVFRILRYIHWEMYSAFWI